MPPAGGGGGVACTRIWGSVRPRGARVGAATVTVRWCTTPSYNRLLRAAPIAQPRQGARGLQHARVRVRACVRASGRPGCRAPSGAGLPGPRAQRVAATATCEARERSAPRAGPPPLHPTRPRPIEFFQDPRCALVLRLLWAGAVHAGRQAFRREPRAPGSKPLPAPGERAAHRGRDGHPPRGRGAGGAGRAHAGRRRRALRRFLGHRAAAGAGLCLRVMGRRERRLRGLQAPGAPGPHRAPAAGHAGDGARGACEARSSPAPGPRRNWSCAPPSPTPHHTDPPTTHTHRPRAPAR